MGRIVVTEFISLDGIVEDPGGGGAWHDGPPLRKACQQIRPDCSLPDAAEVARAVARAGMRSWPPVARAARRFPNHSLPGSIQIC